MKYWPDPNNVDPSVAPWQRNLEWAEHFNKDLFWNWVGKVDHNFGANDRAFFRWGENERNEIGNRGTNAIRSGPAQGGQLPLWRANRALVGDWVHIFGAGTVFNLRASYTYFLEWSYSDPAIGFDSTEFWPASLVQQFPSQDIGGVFPASQCRSVHNPVARQLAQPESQLHGSAQRVAEPRQSQHPQRSRPAVDQRLQRELQQFRRQPRFHPAVHAQHDQQHLRARGERLRVIPPGRAEQRLRGRQPEAALPVALRGALDPGRLARQQQADAEPRLPLGHQRFRDGRRQHAELRVRPDDRQSGVGTRRYASDGWHQVRRRRRRPGPAMEARQGQLAGTRRHGLLDQREDRVPRRLWQVLPEPDRSR